MPWQAPSAAGTAVKIKRSDRTFPALKRFPPGVENIGRGKWVRRMTRRRLWIAVIAVAVALAGLLGAEAAQALLDQQRSLEKARAMTGGDPDRAADAMR